jgi:hypothetical protein
MQHEGTERRPTLGKKFHSRAVCTRILASTLRAVAWVHHFLHEGDVVVSRQVAVLQQVRAIVLGHALDKILDKIVGDKRVPKVEFRDIWLWR